MAEQTSMNDASIKGTNYTNVRLCIYTQQEMQTTSGSFSFLNLNHFNLPRLK